AIITRLNFRTFPAPPASRGFVATFPCPEDALAFDSLVEHSPLRPASIDLLSPQLIQLFLEAEKNSPEAHGAPLQEKFSADAWHLCVSVEGTPEVCERASREFARLSTSSTAKPAQLIALSETEGADLWHYLGQSVPVLLEAFPAAAIFKITLLPSQTHALLHKLHALADQASLLHAILARACGVLYFALLPPSGEHDSLSPASILRLAEAATAIFSLSASERAEATLPWCPTQLKHSINIWGPPRPDLALMRRLKSAFDPQNLFAPGRLLW
ncbi:MAG TPA: FAD-linked oxidase C-terminal domain-containing protein, partial [Candidatus Dormibacteraeota bacterium]|nr:FAD-linked oxidase C-terminal domain-containing protein [Candidatus Dormibacteraeota bacterium]